MVVAACLF